MATCHITRIAPSRKVSALRSFQHTHRMNRRSSSHTVLRLYRGLLLRIRSECTVHPATWLRELMAMNGNEWQCRCMHVDVGKSLPRIMERVNHIHGRMARLHGDLSADVEVCPLSIDTTVHGCNRSVLRCTICALVSQLTVQCPIRSNWLLCMVATGCRSGLGQRWFDKAGI